MIIDKSIGNWFITVNVGHYNIFGVQYVDDLAYHIYCQYMKNTKTTITSQLNFYVNSDEYSEYYDKALYIIRKEKIEKINDIKRNK
ncbi:MAG: hypothetical protein ACOC3V_05155 [bacterium]